MTECSRSGRAADAEPTGYAGDDGDLPSTSDGEDDGDARPSCRPGDARRDEAREAPQGRTSGDDGGYDGARPRSGLTVLG